MSQLASATAEDIYGQAIAGESDRSNLPSMPAKRRESGGDKRNPVPTGRPRNYVPDNAFSRLIHRRKEELNLSWHAIADRGGFGSHTIVYALAKKERHLQPPRQETLQRIAKALQLPLDVVKAAAAEACGYNLQEISVPLSSAEDVKVVVAAMTELSDDDREKFRKMAVDFAEEVRVAKLRESGGSG